MNKTVDKWLLLRRRGRWRCGAGVRVRGGRALGLQVVTYMPRCLLCWRYRLTRVTLKRARPHATCARVRADRSYHVNHGMILNIVNIDKD